MARRFVVALLAWCASSGPSSALPEDLGAPSRGSLTISASGARDGADGPIRSGSLSLRAGTELLVRPSVDAEGRMSAWGLFGQADARAFTTDLSVVEGDRRFFRIGSSLGAFYASPARNLYSVQAGAFVAEQGALLGSAQLHPYGRALGTYRASDGVTLLYGLGYTYDFGRGLPLPFLGVAWRPAPAWRMDVLLPVTARVSWRASQGVTLALGSSVAGDRFRYRAKGDPQDETLRLARVRLGVSARYALSRRTHVGAEVGVEGARIDTGLSTQTAAGGYVEFSWGLRFGDGD